MKKLNQFLIAFLVAVLIFAAPLMAGEYLESLQPDQVIHGFKTLNLYENGSGEIMGARFMSEKYGFLIDLMRIQSVPQAFYWIKTVPTSSKGEPHACEHLLLGKGNRGRYVAALEDMSLGSSTAFTSHHRTCYHFNVNAGEDTFYKIFEAKLQAFLHPDFSDEEIRREVCHIAVDENPETGELAIDEKGTVYTEMVSGYERPWYHTYGALNELIYGKDHPICFDAGGNPEVMRSMVPEDMWTFHKNTHHLANMGAIISIPDEISVEACLKNMSEILERCQGFEDSSETPGISNFVWPPVQNAPIGTLRMVGYPSDKAEDPGYALYAWPNFLKLNYLDRFILGFFLDAFANGETSNLYNLFINSQTRKIDIGGQYVYGNIDEEPDVSIFFGLIGVDNKYITETMVDSIKTLIVNEVRRVHDFADGCEELEEFNTRVRNRLIQNKKQIDNYLNSPPMFGFRQGSAGGWLRVMIAMEDEPGFRKSLVLEDRFAYTDSLLNLDQNIWRELIDKWQLLTVEPYKVGAVPDTSIITRLAEEKKARLAGYIDEFERKYGIDDEQTAIAEFRKEFHAKTAELEALKSKEKLPGFIENPPLTLDDHIKYETIMLPGDIPMIASTFENMTSAQIGLCLKLDVIPESLMVYLPFIPNILTDIGVVKDGQVIPYDEMQERLRQEVLNLYAYFSTSPFYDRYELALVGRGNNLDELKNAINWMNDALYSPYLSVDNIPRMKDLLDQSLLSLRSRMKGSEESWVDIPAETYRYQENPLAMAAGCFLTQCHLYQRLKWMLTDAGEDQQMIALMLDDLKSTGMHKSRSELIEMLSALEELENLSEDVTELPAGLKTDNVTAPSLKLIADIAKDLKVTLADIPDANLAEDWAYLCDETKTDLAVKPEKAISDMENVLNMIRKSDLARMYMISSSGNREATMEIIRELVGKLDSESKPVRQEYARKDRIIEKLKSREPGLNKPIYVGLVHEGTQNGVLIFTAQRAGRYDTTETSIYNCLAGQLLGGGGPHGFFMKTWGAGLAYSNGYSYGSGSGYVRYYAERCPDIAETMRFVVNIAKNAEIDSSLTEYAVAQLFGYSRAPDRYEARGVGIANDLTDGVTPEKVRAFRRKILEYKNKDGLYENIVSHMEEAHGPVFIGYGRPLVESKDGNFFIIGPEPQFESLEKYIEQNEGKQTVYRLYPRDFWLTM